MKKTFSVTVERDTQTGLFVGYVPGFASAHSQGATVNESLQNLREVIQMLLEDGGPGLQGNVLAPPGPEYPEGPLVVHTLTVQ